MGARSRARCYINKRLPGLAGEKVVDSKFNQIIQTPDTHLIVDWHPRHDNVCQSTSVPINLWKIFHISADQTD